MIHHLQHIVDLVEICRIKGFQNVVVSPGSRNAALIKLFASHPHFILHSIVDERSAAFYGLGIALATQKPVALLCTSGTAVLNYAPALAEAYYQRVPLVAITADRPENLIDQQDNQTIRQVNVYQNYIKDSIHLQQPTSKSYEPEAQYFGINKVLNAATGGIKGPVHINVPLNEPFYIEMPKPSANIKVTEAEKIEESSLNGLLKDWQNAKMPMIICGEGVKNKRLNKVITSLSDKAVILAEPISNLKGELIISEVDRLMMKIEILKNDEFKPDLLISFGGPVVSKRLKQWLQKQNNIIHFRIAEEEDKINTYQNLKELIIGNPSQILSKLSESTLEINSFYLENWRTAFDQNNQNHISALEGLPYSDIHVFKQIVQNLPKNCVMHLGNSSPVRFAQLFDLSNCNAVFSNRGVSGIDGCLSTAAGFASQSEKLNLVILGDLSFLYDSNGLWNSQLSANLKIIVINNEGGGIFRLLPGPSEMDSFEEFMETKHPVNIEKLVAAFGVEYFVCKSESELNSTILQFLRSKNGPSLLEIKTPRLENAEVYRKYVEKIMTEDGRRKTED
ncbi:MAG: 2-succinyl-5-enolpyruvyl-6-hydroxy-3-cyclohexene-1-carboxylic-acid synthase [Prolixibacteraceae bacterium]